MSMMQYSLLESQFFIMYNQSESQSHLSEKIELKETLKKFLRNLIFYVKKSKKKTIPDARDELFRKFDQSPLRIEK